MYNFLFYIMEEYFQNKRRMLEVKRPNNPDREVEAICKTMWLKCITIHNDHPPEEVVEFHKYYFRFVTGEATFEDLERCEVQLKNGFQLDHLMERAVKLYYDFS